MTIPEQMMELYDKDFEASIMQQYQKAIETFLKTK